MPSFLGTPPARRSTHSPGATVSGARPGRRGEPRFRPSGTRPLQVRSGVVARP